MEQACVSCKYVPAYTHMPEWEDFFRARQERVDTAKCTTDVLKFFATQADPSNGYLGGYYFSGNPFLFVQYWRSVDDLLAYAQ